MDTVEVQSLDATNSRLYLPRPTLVQLHLDDPVSARFKHVGHIHKLTIFTSDMSRLRPSTSSSPADNSPPGLNTNMTWLETEGSST